MNDYIDRTTQPMAEPMPTDTEAWDIHCAIARSQANVPDADEAWQHFCQLREGAEVRRHARLTAFKRTLGTVAAVAACVAFFVWVLPRQAANGLDHKGGITVLSQTSDGTEVTMIAHQQSQETTNDGQLESKNVVKQVITQKNISFETKGHDNQTQSSVILMATPRGKDCHLTLADGTRVWMNADSRLEFPERFTGSLRTVRLSGEAYFEVAHDRRHPFVVESPYMNVTVLGTTFNMRAYSPIETSVTLVEGRLSILPASAKHATVITPGQQLSLTGDQVSLRYVDTYAYTQCKEGYFYFHDATLRQIMTELGRWYNKTVVFEDADQLDMRLHFVAERSQSLPQVINSLCELDGVDIELGPDDITIK